MHHHLVRVSHLGQMLTRRTGLLARRPPAARPLAPGAGGLPSPSDDGGLQELEESLPRRRSSSATRAASAALAATRLALAWRSWSITIAWTATVASRSRFGGRDRGLLDASRHTRLPMGRREQLSHKAPDRQLLHGTGVTRHAAW
jgi:hypothetical protein